MALEDIPMKRITLTISFDLGVLEVDAKHEQTNRLYSCDCKGQKAINFLADIQQKIADAIKSKESILLKADDSNKVISLNQGS